VRGRRKRNRAKTPLTSKQGEVVSGVTGGGKYSWGSEERGKSGGGNEGGKRGIDFFWGRGSVNCRK